MPVKVIKENKYIVAFFIYHNFSKSLSSSTFPTVLKYADVKPFSFEKMMSFCKYTRLDIFTDFRDFR